MTSWRLGDRGRPLVLSLLVLLAALTAGGSAASGAPDTGPADPVAVDAALEASIAATPQAGVTAIVTTWDSSALDDVVALGVTGTKLRTLPMLITDSLTRAQLDGLRRTPGVRSVWGTEEYETYMEDSTWITKARYVWSTQDGPEDKRGYGITGRGVELAMIDTGFDGSHEDADNLIEYCNSIGSATSTRQLVRCTPWDLTYNTAPAGPCGAAHPGPSNTGPGPTIYPPSCANKARGDAVDPDVSHGTHVGGTMVGTGHASGGKAFRHSTIGMAPDAKFRAYKAGSASLLNTDTLAAYDDLIYKKERGYSRVIAVNNSWGGGDGGNYNKNDPLAVAVKRAYDAGIVSVFAAGNSGPEHNTLSRQCVDPYVVCVAASTKPDSVVMFSSRGRPSQPSDTNRDGVAGGPGDVKPDNHDRLLGQRLGLGLYRPALTAPGVNINSMKAIGASIGAPDAALCREDDLIAVDIKASCYVQANGTSMATPHVAGAIGLIGEALQQRGRNTRNAAFAASVIDILERSANVTKLPAWETEEQGAGRLDVHTAVRYARGEIALNKPNFGYPTPPYAANQYPGYDFRTRAGVDRTRFYDEQGCSGTLSWTAPEATSPVGGAVAQPPLAPPQRYGQHFVNVPPNTDRLRVTVTWRDADNFYVRMWRPGVNPDAESATPDAGPQPTYPGRPSAYHQSRVFPDQEALGLTQNTLPFLGPGRVLEVRAPEEANPGPHTRTPVPGEGSPDPGDGQAAAPTLPSGLWTVRVYHRAGTPGSPSECAGTQETPKQPEGNRYTMSVEMPEVTYRPSVQIDAPPTGQVRGERFVDVSGRAGYPPHTQRPPGTTEPTAPPLGHVGYSWEGITNWEVPGSATSETEEPEEDTRPVLYMHGNTEEGCTGEGRGDVIACNGPFLMPKTPLSAGPAAKWTSGLQDIILRGAGDRTIYDPNWSWCLAPGPGCPTGDPTYVPPGPQTVGGPLTVEWWAQCNTCGGIFGANWTIRVFGDGILRHEERVSAAPAATATPGRLKATVTVPTFTASQRIVVHVEPVYIDSQAVTLIYYDSELACVPAVSSGRCDSLVRMPVVTGGGGGSEPAPQPPANVRVTDLPGNPPESHPYPTSRPLSPALRVAWDPVEGATRYRVVRSTDPSFPNGGTRVYSGLGAECVSPQAPTPGNPPGHDRAGRCFTDTSVSFGTVYYYRVSTDRGTQRSGSSAIAYGMPTRYDRQVKVKVDRLYGPQYWEHALLGSSPTPPDTTNPGTSWRFSWDTIELLAAPYVVSDPALLVVKQDGSFEVRPPAIVAGEGPHLIFARSFTQGIGSTKDGRGVPLDNDGGGGGGGGTPGCPDDDDGDGDDDEHDGDSDDDGDDRDDDCEDDDDDEEEDDD
jgi:serine protease AprX